MHSSLLVAVLLARGHICSVPAVTQDCLMPLSTHWPMEPLPGGTKSALGSHYVLDNQESIYKEHKWLNIHNMLLYIGDDIIWYCNSHNLCNKTLLYVGFQNSVYKFQAALPNSCKLHLWYVRNDKHSRAGLRVHW